MQDKNGTQLRDQGTTVKLECLIARFYSPQMLDFEHSSKPKYAYERNLSFAVFIIVASKTHWSIRRLPSIPPYFARARDG